MPVRLVVILGSTRRGRRGPTVGDWFVGRARQRPDLTLDVVDLAAVSLPQVLHGKGDGGGTGDLDALSARLHDADGFVVITPEYNHSYPASLKHAIDWFGGEWHAKPVGFVCYGGSSGGVRAVEHLRQVFAELHAMTVRNVVSFADIWDLLDADGRIAAPDRYDRAAHRLLDQVVSWAHALRTARDRNPYVA